MEYLISNVEIPGVRRISSILWVSGNFIEYGNHLCLLDGYIVDSQIKNVAEYCRMGLEKHYADGAYNIFSYDKMRDRLEIKTDKRTTMSLYVYEKDGVFAYSNNPWLLIRQFYDKISVNTDSLKAQLLYFADYHATRTLFTNISRVDGACYICFDVANNFKKDTCYWAFKYIPDSGTNLNQLLEKVDSDFTSYFKTVREQNPKQIAGFGCSGGLDSRIIAHYIHKTGIECKPYVFGDEKPHYLFRSTTAKMSSMVGDCYGFDVTFIPYRTGWLRQSMILDIRNSPFIYSQAFINPCTEVPDVDYIFAGDPGALGYMADYILSGDVDKLKSHADYFIGIRHWAIAGATSVLRKAAGHLRIPFNLYENEGILGLNHSTIDKVIEEKTRQSCRDELFACIDMFGGDNNVERWMRIHDKVTTKYQYSSGYTSVNHTKRCYLLYYPFYYDTIATIPPKYFKDKFLLKKIIGHINPSLLEIPDQNLNLIYGIPGWTNKLKNRLELAMRGRGLNFLRLLHTSDYKKFAYNIFKRDNPIFYSIVNKEQLFRSGLIQCYAGVHYLKLKMMLDIFFYKEFDQLFETEAYGKPEW